LHLRDVPPAGVRAILTGHSHYDHFGDVPVVAARASAAAIYVRGSRPVPQPCDHPVNNNDHSVTLMYHAVALRTKEDVVEEFRKQSICDAAMRVVARKGLASVTVQDIADEAGVAKGTVYIYFDSREEIIARTMDGATEKLVEKLSVACRGCRTFREVLEQRVRTQLLHFEENRDFFRLYLAMAEPFGERRLKKHPTYLTYLKQLEKLIGAAIERKEIVAKDVGRLAIAISSVVREIVLHRIIEREPPPLEEDVTFAVDFIMRGISEEKR
jgi:AcrR family transcriptional regulator